MPWDLLGASAYLEACLLQDILQVQVINGMCETRNVHCTAERRLLSLHHVSHTW